MASMAGPPSGRGIDKAYILSRLANRVRHVESEWGGSVQISAAGRAHITRFALLMLSDLDRRGLPPGVDESALVRELDTILPDFLEAIRSEAQATGAMIRVHSGASELPAELIAQRLPLFTARRCLCWPQ